jgi:hypothetical protein
MYEARMIHKLVEIPTEVVNEYYIVNWTKVLRPLRSDDRDRAHIHRRRAAEIVRHADLGS